MDGVIDSTTAQRIWVVVSLVAVLPLIVRHRLLGPPRGPIVRFGGPWTLLRRRFWEDRDPGMSPAARRGLGAVAILLGGLYAVLDLIY